MTSNQPMTSLGCQMMTLWFHINVLCSQEHAMDWRASVLHYKNTTPLEGGVCANRRNHKITTKPECGRRQKHFGKLLGINYYWVTEHNERRISGSTVWHHLYNEIFASLKCVSETQWCTCKGASLAKGQA